MPAKILKLAPAGHRAVGMPHMIGQKEHPYDLQGSGTDFFGDPPDAGEGNDAPSPVNPVDKGQASSVSGEK